MSQIPKNVVFFAQVPPPEHGQSRMVALAIQSLRKNLDDLKVFHVNARFSQALDQVGVGSLGKLLLTVKYLAQAIYLRIFVHKPLLYYVPGPVKWSPVIRDWILLLTLRVFYGRVIFHWHAIGQGEWSQGSQRLALSGPRCVDRIARRISRFSLRRPYASIAVSNNSQKDSISVDACRALVVLNGIEDPCPDYDSAVLPVRIRQTQILRDLPSPTFSLLFLSHGTEEKGILDALDALSFVLQDTISEWSFCVTFAGGIVAEVRKKFDVRVSQLKERWSERFSVRDVGYVTGEEKRRCFLENLIFIAPSRWESFGISVAEAMAYGMQIVACASDGVAGLLPAGHRYLAPVSHPELLGKALRECCEDLKIGDSSRDLSVLRERFLEHFQLHDFSVCFAEAMKSLSRGRYFKKSLNITAYLADQNPGYDRSFGISRMSYMVLQALAEREDVEIHGIVSSTSQRLPKGRGSERVFPWGTRNKVVRFVTDHFHPLFPSRSFAPDIFYFPKGFLPFLHFLSRPSVVTIHDTIIQYDEDHFPQWRSRWEYGYWAMMLKHTLRRADRIMTVSESSRKQILAFMKRHRLPTKEVAVTYEPCAYESIPQPVSPIKQHHVIHLASCEPHKRTAHLIRWWREAEEQGRDLPTLHLIGKVPPEVEGLLRSSRTIVKRPFLDDAALQDAYSQARALVLPSEIEGFGLPALEAYYLGTPVCFVKGTSVEEILGVATSKGSFDLNDSQSLFDSLAEVMAMDPDEVSKCGLKLRETYAAAKVAEKMIEVFMGTANNGKAEEMISHEGTKTRRWEKR